MKILSIDTSSNICGVSILEDDKLICNSDTNTGRTHSENLMPMIQKSFEESNLTLKDIKLLVCDKGPGSFTGIRIGVSTVKAFHDSLNIPFIGVSSLESLAYNIKNEGLIISLIDCKNSNCYFAIYKLTNSKYTEILSPSTDSIIKALDICKDYISLHFQEFLTKGLITFVGDGSIIYKDNINSKFTNCIFADSKDNSISSYSLGLAGFNKFKLNKFDDVLPLYLKKPQAQKQLEQKSN